MPVSRRQAKNANLRTEVAGKLGIGEECIFFMLRPRGKTIATIETEGWSEDRIQKAMLTSRWKPVLAIWTENWCEEEIQRIRAMKPEVKAMAAAVGAKIYMTPIHPHEQEARETARRKARGRKHRQRQSAKTQKKLEESAKKRILTQIDIIPPRMTGQGL